MTFPANPIFLLVRLALSLYLIVSVNKLSRFMQKKYGPKLLTLDYQNQTFDLTHKLTASLYRFFLNNQKVLTVLLFVLMVHVNISIALVLIKCFYDVNALFVTIATFALKSGCNILYKNIPPEGRYNNRYMPNKKLHWSNNAQGETFFSGHTSIVVLAIVFAPTLLKPIFSYGGFITILSLLTLRIHYCIDVLGACLVIYFFNGVSPFGSAAGLGVALG